MAWETVPTVGIPEALTESGPVLTNFHRPEDTKEAVERALYAILGHGAFQRRIMACSLLSMVVLLCHSLAYRAIASPVDHWCARPAAFGAMPVPLWRNVAIPVESDGSFSQCTVYEPPVPADDALDHTRHAVPCESWEYATAFRNRSIVSEWDLVCERRRLVQLSSAAYMAGAMLCVPIVGLLSDRTGRKPVITGSVSALILAAIVCSTTHSFVVFVLSRMVVSAMSSAAQVLSFILLYEVTGPDRRAAYALLATGTGIMLMPVVLELLAAAQFSWPATQLLLLMPTVSLVYSHYLLEESPSWLLATWRLKRAEEALLVAARRNGLVVEKAARFFRKLKAEMRRHAHAHLAATAAEAIRSDANKTAGSDSMVAEFLSGRRAVSVFLAWFTVMFCFYGIQLADQDLDGGVDAWLRWDDVAYVVTLAPLIAGTYAGMLRYGQRRTFTMLLALVFEASALLVLVPLTAERDWLPSALVKVSARAVTAAATSANYLYTAEAFPATVRSTGLTVSYASGRVGAIFATSLMSVQVSYTVPFMNVVMMVLAFGTLVAVQTAPEPAAQAGKGGGGNAPAIGSPSSGSTAVEGSEAPAQTTDRFAGWDVAHDSTAPMTSTLARSSAQLQQSGSIEARDDSIESASGGVPFDANISKLPDEF
ncbi:solute carrier family 22 member 7-like isoform X1 [Dermacentor albipictus]|uniref:solute carrier family 22 member 7-like isoform X1 n=1 Tax=Dermacentor albipictus TaxID=60249 RepID=UPI0031FE0267